MLPEATEHLSPVWARYSNIVVDHAQGAYIYAEDGKRYLDFTCGIGVTNTGHCHPQVVAAAQEQVGKLIHGQANIVYHRPMLDLVDQLLTVVPEPLDTFFFSNSGAEAIEASVKLARAATGRPNIISFVGGFHGRTNAAMALTSSKAGYRSRYAPLAAGIHIAPYPYAYRMKMSPAQVAQFCLDELDYMFETQTAPDQVAGILIEPVLGEGGYLVPPDGFLQGLQAIANKHGIMLIADEVQSGFGRTGKWFGLEHYHDASGVGIEPDIMQFAKGITSGYVPLGGIGVSDKLMNVLNSVPPAQRWMHAFTYSAHPTSCAVALANIKIIQDENLVERAAEQGEKLQAQLRALGELEGVGNVRGLGLIGAVELVADKTTKAAYPADRQLNQRGMDMLLANGLYTRVLFDAICVSPPLVITDEQIERMVNIIRQTIPQLLDAVS